MDEASPIKLVSRKKRRYSVDSSLCFICRKPGDLKTPGTKGTESFLEALFIRRKCGEFDLNDLSNVIDINKKVFNAESIVHVRWHKNCYASYVSKRNLNFVSESTDTSISKDKADEDCSILKVTRSRSSVIDFKKVCMFCERTNHKGDRTLIRVEYETFWVTLADVCKKKGDAKLALKVGGDFSKLPALEARYHRACHAAYTKPCYQKSKNYFDEAFETFRIYFDKLLCDGRAVLMDILLKQYKVFLANSGQLVESLESYTIPKLKDKILKCYGDSVTFADSKRKNEAQFVYSSAIDIQDVINVASDYRKSLAPDALEMITDTLNNEIAEDQNLTTLYRAANILKAEMEGTSGIETFPLNPEDIEFEKVKELVPLNLIKFLKWSCGESDNKVRKIYSIAQTMIYVASNGTKKMPKQVGIAVGMKNSSRSKEFITVLNRHGDSISYQDVLRVENYWANQLIETGSGYATIPTNIGYGHFTQAASDNSDYTQENASQHITSTVLYQYPLNGTFGEHGIQTMKTGAGRNRSVNLPTEPILKFKGKSKPNVPAYFGITNIEQITKN